MAISSYPRYNMMLEFIGTSHISEESIGKITQKISEEKPDIVAIELDSARLNALLDKKPINLSRIGQLNFLDLIKQLGLFGFLFQLIGAHFQKRLGKQVAQMPGIDMKTAYLAAKKISAKIFLIDQPISITLQKLSRLKLREKLRFIFYLLANMFFPEKINFDLRKVPGENIVLELTKDFKKKFPGFYKILVTERDKYIANQIKLLEKKFPGESILFVLGAGHLTGVKKLLKNS